MGHAKVIVNVEDRAEIIAEAVSLPEPGFDVGLGGVQVRLPLAEARELSDKLRRAILYHMVCELEAAAWQWAKDTPWVRKAFVLGWIGDGDGAGVTFIGDPVDESDTTTRLSRSRAAVTFGMVVGGRLEYDVHAHVDDRLDVDYSSDEARVEDNFFRWAYDRERQS